MTDRKWRIAISCIGSGVGQSVINSCRLSRLPLHTIGLGTNALAYGAYECDEMDFSPNIYSENYCGKLIEILTRHHVDLVVPGLDDEVLLFAQAKEAFAQAGIRALASDAPLVELCRDKARMGQGFGDLACFFVKSFGAESCREALARGELAFPLIAKPRAGFASRGIEILHGEADLERVTSQHIVQELAVPCPDDPQHDSYMGILAKRQNPQVSEVSVQLLADRHGDLLARMASYNRLNNGVPIEVLPYDDARVWDAVDQLYPVLRRLGLRGPLNLQGRVTSQGFKIFEMNPRFTGITGLRAVMGFNEVEAAIKDWLEIPGPPISLGMNGLRFGLRQTADKSVSLDRSSEVRTLSERLNRRVLKTHKTVLITGASGLLGRHLVQRLVEDASFEIWAVGRLRERLAAKVPLPEDQVFTFEDLRNGAISLGQVDCLVHAAFARPHHGQASIAESMSLAADLFERAREAQVPSIINISSQSVYGPGGGQLWREEDPPAPDSVYGAAKWAAELSLRVACRGNHQMRATSLRLATLTGGNLEVDQHEFLFRMISQALGGAHLRVLGGHHRMARLDVADAVSAILAILKTDPLAWAPIYNVDNEQGYRLMDLGRRVATVVGQLTGRPPVEVIQSDEESALCFGLDASQLKTHTGWSPETSIEESIARVARFLLRDGPQAAKLDS
jgi:nucleoside-diphosphate-sugar epimerase